MVRSGRGPISYPTGQPSGSWKYVETGTSLYVQPRRLTKLVLYATTNQKHVDVVEEEKEKRCDQGTECRGCYYIVLTAKEALGMQNTIK
jgi:hypothetical protein